MSFTPYQSTIHWGCNEQGAAYQKLVKEIVALKGKDWNEAKAIRVAVVLLARRLGIQVPPAVLKKSE